MDYLTSPHGITEILDKLQAQWRRFCLQCLQCPNQLVRQCLAATLSSTLSSIAVHALEQGLSEEEATRRSIETMLENSALLTGTNTLEGLLLGAPNITTSALKRAMQGLARGGLNMELQGLEEGWQKAISNAQAGRPYSVNPIYWFTDPRYDEQRREHNMEVGGMVPMVLMASRPNTSEQN